VEPVPGDVLRRPHEPPRGEREEIKVVAADLRSRAEVRHTESGPTLSSDGGSRLSWISRASSISRAMRSFSPTWTNMVLTDSVIALNDNRQVAELVTPLNRNAVAEIAVRDSAGAPGEARCCAP